ncbi:hypothetical protein NLJ89_g11186 [Agrocybe chaxingu]|uniref:Uncharacterized protein n=1 Tax=Agrocybe chaxingu TaxID=84603 RepID=A0A9W8MRE2_9AGAR|nr:hypothetical protein NLJ89_g11186 [Agrocybe chaxingu]
MSAPPPRVPPLLPPFAIASAARPFESIDELNEHPAKRTKKTPLHTLSTPKRAPKKGKVDSKAKTKAKAKAKTPDLDSSDLFESDEAPPPKTDKGKAKATPSSILDTVEIAELYDSDPVEYVANSSTYDGRD